MSESSVFETVETSSRDRFLACMDYHSCTRPNHELGVWGQTRARWEQEAAEAVESFTWDWFVCEPGLGLDRREFINVNYGFVPPFPIVTIEEGGFIPTVDHTVPPDVSWDDFKTYMDLKRSLLAGDFNVLE